VKRLLAALDTEGGVRFLWWVIGGSLIVGFFVFLAVGANGPKDPELTPRAGVEGFGSVALTVEHGAVTDNWCALLAATDAQRETGMMGRHDLGGYDAMVFAWPTPVDNSQVYFYNRKVPIALSIAWFDSGGRFVSTADMDPCGDIPTCPTFKAAGRYQFAVEVPKGGLGRLGIAPGAIIDVKSSC
jgi:uncharacterized membrane protein (UPF0127 family)